MEEGSVIETIIVGEDEGSLRLDAFLAKRFAGVCSRSYFEKQIAKRLVLVNGEAVKKRYQPVAEDEIEVAFTIDPIDIRPEPIPLDILFEDAHLLVINKPVGMVVHPAPGNWTGTFVNALAHHCSSLCNSSSIRPGIVHRLDKETSGVLVAAKTEEAHQELVRQFAQREVFKEYLAISYGKPKEGVIDAPIGRHPVKRKQMAVVETGKPARTHCKILKQAGVLYLLSLTLETGRTHQIRVHLRHVQAPILGDSLYGNSQANARYSAKRQLLHAHKLEFCHPVTGERLKFQAPPPEDLALFMTKFVDQ